MRVCPMLVVIKRERCRTVIRTVDNSSHSALLIEMILNLMPALVSNNKFSNCASHRKVDMNFNLLYPLRAVCITSYENQSEKTWESALIIHKSHFLSVQRVQEYSKLQHMMGLILTPKLRSLKLLGPTLTRAPVPKLNITEKKGRLRSETQMK